MKNSICVILLVILVNKISAQELFYPTPFNEELPFTSVIVDENTPEWAKLLYTSDPNLRDINRLFLKWRKENPDLKNGHTRNYKHFLTYLVKNNAITQKGKIDLTHDQTKKDDLWLKKRATLLKENRNRNSNTWETLGPTLVPETQGRVNAQSNIYAIDQSKSNPDILYAGTETGYVFKTMDKGENWFSVSDDYNMGGYMELEIHPINPDIVYLGTSHDIMKTTDGGATWNSIRYNWNQRMSSIIINPDDPQIILAGGVEGLYKSSNGGASWTTITTTRIFDLKYKSDDPNIVVALQDNPTDKVTDLYRSTDAGDSFVKITNGWNEPDPSSSNKGGRLTNSDIYPGVMYSFTGASYTTLANPKNGIKIRKSSDAGQTWQLLVDSDQVFTRSTGSGTSIINNGQGYYDWDIEMMDADTNVVMLGTQGKWLTEDGFSSTVLKAWGSDVGGHSDLQESLFNGADYWVATDGGIVKCSNDLLDYGIKMNGINCAEFWSFDQGWNRDAQVGTLYHNGTIGSTDSYDMGVFRFFGGAEPQFSALKHPYPDKIISKGYGSVNGRSMPDNFDDPETSFSYNLQPNSYYAIWLTNEESEIEVCPFNYNIHWAGEGNKLMKSTNFGTSWTGALTGRVDGKITKIEIPKSNPDVMYVAEWEPSGYAIYKSLDGGESFAALANLPSLPGSDDDGIFMSMDQTNEDVLFIAFRENDNDNDKVWKTSDGGISWTNINTGSDLLDGESITDLQAISGTEGDIYLTTEHGVFHRSNTENWTACIDGLPANLRIRHIKPFYKEGKMRIATMNRGVYSMNMINQPTVIEIQPTVNNTEGLCEKDTFYFEDYSILNHDNTTWSWEFEPAPSFVDDANSRNPKVLFPGNGSYQAILSVTKDGTVYSDSLDQPIVINSKCHPDDYSGGSYQLVDYGDHGIAEDPERIESEWTISFWIKPALNTNETATIFDALDENNSRQFCANFYGTSPNLTMHYRNAGSNAWGVNPGMPIVYDEWNHIAYTSSVLDDEVTIYVNGESFVYPNVTPLPTAFDKMVIGWQNAWWGGRFYEGEIDELAIYSRVLDQDELRLRMHITKDLSTDADLIHYFQWNEGSNGISYDKINTSHMTLPSSVIESNGPFADGTSSKMNINSGGLKSFPNEGLEMTFSNSGSYPDGEVVVTRLDTIPDYIHSLDEASQKYWVVHNFGANQNFTALDNINFEGFGQLSSTEANNPSEFLLFRRDFGLHSDSWGVELSSATNILESPDNILEFDTPNLSLFGQLYMTKGDCKTGLQVLNADDSGDSSLRDIIQSTCPGDTIYFDPGIDMSEIILTSTQIDIDKNIYLVGNGKLNTLIDGDGSNRIFRILDSKTKFGIQNMTLQNGFNLIDGGSILNYGNSSVKNVLIKGSFEGNNPKALTNYGTIKILEGDTEIKE